MKNYDRNIVRLNQKPSQPQLLKPDSNKEKRGKFLIFSSTSPFMVVSLVPARSTRY
jgi:hypothetical protein